MLLPVYKNRICLYCGKALKGRPDKKYCNDGCRNSYNNSLKGPGNNFVRNVNNALAKNRRILESLLPERGATAKVNKEKLQGLGFQFNYLTQIYANKKGGLYHFCYDLGYLPLDNGWYLIVRRQEK